MLCDTYTQVKGQPGAERPLVRVSSTACCSHSPEVPPVQAATKPGALMHTRRTLESEVLPQQAALRSKRMMHMRMGWTPSGALPPSFFSYHDTSIFPCVSFSMRPVLQAVGLW